MRKTQLPTTVEYVESVDDSFFKPCDADAALVVFHAKHATLGDVRVSIFDDLVLFESTSPRDRNRLQAIAARALGAVRRCLVRNGVPEQRLLVVHRPRIVRVARDGASLTLATRSQEHRLRGAAHSIAAAYPTTQQRAGAANLPQFLTEPRSPRASPTPAHRRSRSSAACARQVDSSPVAAAQMRGPRRRSPPVASQNLVVVIDVIDSPAVPIEPQADTLRAYQVSDGALAWAADC